MNRKTKLALAVGYLSMAAGISAAAAHPATGYEPSIYHGTPTIVWPFLGLALVVGLHKGWSRDRIERTLAMPLSTGPVLTVVFLPYIRGYRYLGEHDSLSQLGWARSLRQGTLEITDLFYPILHHLAVSQLFVLDISLERSLLLVTCVFTAVFVASIVPAVRHLVGTNDPQVTSIALVSALLFLPIILIRVPVLQPIPATLAILFFPMVLFLYFLSAERPTWRTQLLFFVGLLSLLLLHPQQAFNFCLMILFLGGYGVIAQRTDRVPNSSYAPSLSVLTFAAVIVGAWISTQPAFVFLVVHILSVLASPGGLDAGAAQETGSVPDVNVYVIILKLFVISALYVFLTAWLSLKATLETIRSSSSAPRSGLLPTYRRIFELLIGILPLVLITGLFVVSGRTNQIFRYVGLGLAFVTITGAISIYALYRRVKTTDRRREAAFTLRLCLLVFLIISLPILHPSPYISKPTGHVTHQKFVGYETTFDQTNDDVPITTLYSPANRYRDGVFGRQESRFGIGVPQAETVLDSDPPSAFEPESNVSSPYYMILTESDRYRAITHYQEQRYSRAQFDTVATTDNISKVYSSSEFTLYLVHNDTTETAP